MKNILVLTDFSENALAAELYAFEMALQLRCGLVLYNTYSKSGKVIAGNIVWPHEQVARSMELESISNLQSRVNELERRLKKMRDIPYTPSIIHFGNEGKVTDHLNTVVMEKGIDMIVMGTRGESRASNVLFGSHVFHVVEKAARPVLIVPENAQFRMLDKIAYATDLKTGDMQAVEWMYEFAEALKIKSSIIHVSSIDVSVEDKIAAKKQEQLYKTEFPNATIELFEGENIHSTLHKVAEREDIGILALMHRKHGFFESLTTVSTTHKVIRHTEQPILVFTEEKS